MPIAFAFLLVASLLPTTRCADLAPPPPASVLVPFEQLGRWEGHFGIDVASQLGASVHPIGTGVVSFVGVVVGNRTVTIDHGGGLRTSYSYLAETTVRAGIPVSRASTIGVSGVHDGHAAYHLSVRIGGEYVDPQAVAVCPFIPMGALYLAAGPSYPRSRVRHSRRDVRSSPHRPPRARCDRARAARPRRRAIRSRT